MGELNEGPFVEGSWRAFKTIPSDIQSLASETGGDSPLELLFLFSPAVCFAGLWARHRRVEHDFVRPILPKIRELPPTINSLDLIEQLYLEGQTLPNDRASGG